MQDVALYSTFISAKGLSIIPDVDESNLSSMTGFYVVGCAKSLILIVNVENFLILHLSSSLVPTWQFNPYLSFKAFIFEY